MKKVFISHSSKDKATGDEVCRFLEANGIWCWIAPRDVTPGKNYGVAIVDAIDECAVFVLILSSESNKSGQVVREVERAASSNSVIIPLRVEPVEPSRNLEFYVSSSHWLDATEKPLAQHLGKLLAAIRNWESGAETKSEPASPASAPVSSTPTPRSSRPLLIAAAAIAAILLCALVVFFRSSESVQRHVTPAVTPSSISSPTSAPRSTSTPETLPNTEISIAPTPSLAQGRAAAPIIQKITASSVLEPETHRGELRRYDAKLAFDNDETTAWVPTSNGVNQWIKADFKSPVAMTSVSIYGGYGVDARRYNANNRARSIRVNFSDASSETFSLEDKMKLQRFELRHPVVTYSAKIEILAVYRGERHDETAISEIAFNRDQN